MKLSDLNPHWTGMQWFDETQRVYIGVRFDCPHCHEKQKQSENWPVQRLAVFFTPPIGDLDKNLGEPSKAVYLAAPKWERVGEEFETISLRPSIDTEWAGHWHGFIENGEIK